MQQFPDSPQFEPYQLYRVKVNAIQDFAEQSLFSHRIAQQIIGSTPAGADRPQQEDASFIKTNQALLAHCFVMEWLLFENFVKHTAFTLLTRYPAKIGELAPDRRLTFREISDASGTFTSLELLRDELITHVIERQLGGDRSFKRLIDFLARTFRFQNLPYDVEYLYKGQRITGGAHDLAGFHTAYLSILPEVGGKAQPSGGQGQPIAMSEEAYLKAQAFLHAVAASIAQTIDNQWYDPR